MAPPRNNSNGDLKIIRPARKLTFYNVTKEEIDTMGSLNVLCQIFLGLATAAGGAFVSALIQVNVDTPTATIWVIFWASLILTVVFSAVFAIALWFHIRNKTKLTA